LTPVTPETAVNIAWVLLCGFLVMFMQAGFAMVETGFTRSKNAVHTMAMNFVIYPLGIIGFWLMGYAILAGGVSRWPSLGGSEIGAHEVGFTAWGHTFGLFGASKFALASGSEDPASLVTFLFAAVFMDTAATIPTGAMAERWKFSSFVAYGLFISASPLSALCANWVRVVGSPPSPRISAWVTGWSTSLVRPSST
jgi:Amt family ammonium transporter